MSQFRRYASSFVAAAVCCLMLPTGFLSPAQARERHPMMHKEHHPLVHKALHRTHMVLMHAAAAVKKGGAEKDTFHQAVTHQAAARWAMQHDKTVIAMHLTLKARELARKAIQANKVRLVKEDQGDDPEETKAAAGASEQEASAAVSQASGSIGTADKCVAAADVCDKE